jgi:hypothetical protein
VRFWDSHARIPREKSHLDVGPVERCRIYYKGEGGGFPQVRAVVSLVCPCCPWLVVTPKVFQLCTNHFVWGVCRPVWVSEACQLFLIPSWSSNTPLYPSKCCELWSVPRLFPFQCLVLGLASESFKELGVRRFLTTWTHSWQKKMIINNAYIFLITTIVFHIFLIFKKSCPFGHFHHLGLLPLKLLWQVLKS